MADVQLEHGHLKVAFDLSGAIPRMGLTALEHDVLWSLMNMTYGRGLKEAQLSVEDFQALIGRSIRPARVLEVIEKLIDRNIIVCNKVNQYVFILGIQKDFEKWGANEPTVNKIDDKDIIIYSTNNIPISNEIDGSGMTALAEHIYKLWKINPPTPKRKSDVSTLRKFYGIALNAVHDPQWATGMLYDYVDYLYEDEWKRANLSNVVGFMASRFGQWFAIANQAKVRDVREMEQLTNKRYRYNVRISKWEPVPQHASRS